MKCIISSVGTLRITAENEIEEYALTSWAEGIEDSEETTKLMITYGDLALESEVGSKQILDDVTERKRQSEIVFSELRKSRSSYM